MLNTSTKNVCQYCHSGEGLRRGAVLRRESTKLPGRRPPTHRTGIGLLNDGVMFGEISFVCAFFGFRIVHGWMGMDV